MFGLSGEHIILFVILLFIFGPKQLPALGRTLGKTMRNMRDTFGGIKEPSYRKLSEKIIPPQDPRPKV